MQHYTALNSWCNEKYRFWATVCKTVRPMLSDGCPVFPVLFVCNVGVLWPNGWMHRDEIWQVLVGLRPGHIVLNGDPAPPPSGTPPFSAHVLWPNGWMDQDATW